MGCDGCKSISEETKSLSDVNNVTPEQGMAALYGAVEDSCATTTTTTSTEHKAPIATNKAEVKADEQKKEKIKEDLAKSKYSSCDEIIEDYKSILTELRKGNRKPLKEFPIATDPKIAICRSMDKSFAIQLDSLQGLSNKIIDDL